MIVQMGWRLQEGIEEWRMAVIIRGEEIIARGGSWRVSRFFLIFKFLAVKLAENIKKQNHFENIHCQSPAKKLAISNFTNLKTPQIPPSQLTTATGSTEYLAMRRPALDTGLVGMAQQRSSFALGDCFIMKTRMRMILF